MWLPMTLKKMLGDLSIPQPDQVSGVYYSDDEGHLLESSGVLKTNAQGFFGSLVSKAQSLEPNESEECVVIVKTTQSQLFVKKNLAICVQEE